MSYGIAGGDNGGTENGAKHSRTSVLLAEDEPQTCEFIRRTLETEYEVEIAGDQRSTLEHLHVRHPDIVLIDTAAHELDAPTVLKEIRRDPVLQNTPVIILAASPSGPGVDGGIKQGADDFITRPFTESELLARIAARLEIARLRKEAEEARLRADLILESITDGFLAINSEWKFTYINPPAQRMMNRKREEVIGKGVWDEYPYMVGTEVHRVLTRAMVEQKSAAIQFEEPRTGLWYDLRVYPCVQHGVAIYLRDITGERYMHEALRESEERYRVLVEVAPQIIWSARPDGAITYANQRWFELTGLTMEQTKGIGWTEAVHPDHLDRILHIWRESIRNGTITDSEFPIRVAADGTHRWHHFRGLPVFDAEGRITRWMGVAIDIHDRKMAAREREQLLHKLQENDRKKDEFLAMLAHELRNPLAAVGNAVAVLEMSDDAADRHWACEVVQRQVGQLTRIVDDLLDVSRITSGKIRLRKKRLDVAETLDQAVTSVTSLMANRRHELISTYDRNGTLMVEADPARMEQIVVNLLTNSAKYTEPGGRIWLTAQREDGKVTISVRDTGIGIPPEKLPEMFELFAQGERSIARSEGGLGLGLTIVQRLTEMHGGKVTAYSEGPGLGSEFCLCFPAIRKGSNVAGTTDHEQMHPHGARILVVDDNVDTVQGLARLLKFQGHTVETAYNGPTALEVARKFKPAVVLLDIGLPGMDGYHVATKLRESPEGERMLLIAISGYGQDEDRKRSKEAGFDHHLVKPVDLAELKRRLATRSRGEVETH